MHYLALTVGNQTITAPKSIPSGGLSTVTKVIGNAITILLIITTVLSLIYLIIGGIMWINSGGDKSKVAAARNRITYAIIGLLVALLAYFIVNVIGYIFNVNLLNL
jgi:Type IV secretion system pilin